MPRAKLTVEIPEGVWIGDATRSAPEARVRVLAAVTEDDTGVALAEVRAPDPRALVGAVGTADAVTDVSVLRSAGHRALVEFETDEPLLLFPLRNAGVPLETPFDVHDGTATWELTASADRLSALGDQLDAFGIEFTVEYVRQHVEERRPLTDRQRGLVVAAVEHGYYDTPRDCTLTELAEAVGIAKSTCSETLHRAEEAIVKRYVEELPDPDREGADAGVADGDDDETGAGPTRAADNPNLL
jgi:predicted DNA binding protein